MEHNEYITRRDKLEKIRTDSINSFDKAILTLATGALALSIAFLDKIGRPFNELTFYLIGGTWVGLSIVLLLNMLSFFFAQKNMDKKIVELDENYRKQKKEGKKVEEVDEKTFWQRKATTLCNDFVLVFFLISIFIFTWYIIEIQRNNYRELIECPNDTETPIRLKKAPGKTEIEMIKSRREVSMSKGTTDEFAETETPWAEAKPITLTPSATQEVSQNKMVDSDLGEGKGLTEIPEAEPRPEPEPPSEDDTSGSKTGE